MKSRLLFLFIIATSALLLSSCDNNSLIKESKSVHHPWLSNQTIEFEFEVTDTIASHSFYIDIRNNTDYSYSNVFFFINTTFPNGTMTKDTVECILADVRGKWLGKGMGSIKESTHVIREDLVFPLSGLYKMEFVQAMRDHELYGIEDVGIDIFTNLK